MSLVWPILLLAWPLIEIAVLIKAGGWLGFWPTLLIVIGSGLLGASVLMRYGLDAALKVQEAMVRGETPLLAMMDGALVALAGGLLIVPGLLADVVGLALLIPPLRGFLARRLLRSMLGMSDVDGDAREPRPSEGGRPRQSGFPPDGPVIEGEFERLDERPVDPPRRPSGRDPKQG